MDPCKLVLTSSRLARLEERLAHIPEEISAGWVNRMMLAEAAAGARLNGYFLSVDDLMMADVDGLDVLRSRELTIALDELALLRIAAFRSPRQMFTPLRLMSLSRARVMVGGEKRTIELMGVERFSPSGADTIRKAFSKENTQAWRKMDPVSGAASLVAEWHNSECAIHFGMSAGRILAAAWVARSGLTTRTLPIFGIGFRGHLNEYRPDGGLAWNSSLLNAIAESISYGEKVLSILIKASDSLKVLVRPSRSTSRFPDVAKHLIATPAVTALSVSRATGISQRASSDMLDKLANPPASKGVISPVRELTGRDSFRVYGINIFGR